MEVVFRPYKAVNVNGKPYEHSLPYHFNTKFYLKCMMMPRKKPISYDEAANLCCNFIDYLSDLGQHKLAAEFAQEDNWVDFISEQGYHVEFTGDEFEIIENRMAA